MQLSRSLLHSPTFLTTKDLVAPTSNIMPFSEFQRKALAITPKFTGFLSFAGSFLIVRDVIVSEKHRSSTYHRLLLGMSTIDLSVSLLIFLSTWPIPAGSPIAWGAVGNQATCTLQGAMGQLSVGAPMYNASLSVFYMLMATFRWDENKIRRRAEPLMHFIPFAFSISTALAGIPLTLYNNAILWCWFAGYPLGCKESFVVGKENGTCIRGDNASLYRLLFWFGPVWLVTFIATFSMALIYITVLQKERSVDEYNPEGVNLRTQSRRIASQALWYLLAFYITFTPSTIGRILEFMGKPIPFGLLWSMTFMMPSQGFFNYLVYARSKFVSYRRAHPDATAAQALRSVATAPRNRSSLTESVPPEEAPKGTPEEKKSSMEAIEENSACSEAYQ